MREPKADPVLVDICAVTKRYAHHVGTARGGRSSILAVADLSLSVRQGRTLGIVGESGSGKSTLGRLISRLETPDSGSIIFDGRDVSTIRGRELREFRRQVQTVFQDPYSSLDPTKTVGHAIAEPLHVHREARSSSQRRARAIELAERVGLPRAIIDRFPTQLSGGQRQRVAIARALALGPRLVVADEPTSALDLSTRSEILNLLVELQDTEDMTLVLISHDFASIRHVAHDVAVMHHGRLVEVGSAAHITETPTHPYTQALLSAVLPPHPRVAREKLTMRAAGPSPTEAP
ncbi:ABC transporter ATP-binding protein [Aeromicrobium phragmitis]|uniref:ABC transporter ATP-binding protein n=1 Tax=Aeromicrobium phragmitis TaxID=2478914 RepID=A0A3L8PPF2_9ACTN|nr:ABC transporter ATP-binding protein [Aeromicrobium phragmitis]RLV57251.1 ABC transporter ATP-binding protein [Aeromicrobium phragmitis]